jgi:muramoyltetrapeptide carboxypeptidase
VLYDDPGVFSATGYLAGSDDRRADELNGYLRNPDVRAIVASRGGYGIMRILERLDADALRRDPKLIVGFSDVTALLCWARARAGVRGIHGPVAAQLGELGREDEAWLYQLMESTAPLGRVPADLSPLGATASGRSEGRIWGGNLCILAHLAGTAYAPRLAGAIAVFEDVGERPYAVDRYLTRLALAGVLDGVEAVALGDFTRCEETVGPPDPDVWSVLDERLASFGLAGVRGLPVGHADRNLALPLGARCAIDFESGELHFLEAAVA